MDVDRKMVAGSVPNGHHHAGLTDHDLMGDKAGHSHEEAAHIGELTAEELVRKLTPELIWKAHIETGH